MSTPKTPETNFIANLINLRRSLNLSQNGLAQELGISFNIIANYEAYRTRVCLEHAHMIAKYFQSDVSEMIEDIITPNNSQFLQNNTSINIP